MGPSVYRQEVWYVHSFEMNEATHHEYSGRFTAAGAHRSGTVESAMV